MFTLLLVIGSMHPGAGGPPRVVAGSSIALAKAGIRVEIASIGLAVDHDTIIGAWPELAELDIPVHLFAPTGPPALGRSTGLRRFVAREATRFDAVHVHGVWEMVLGEVAWHARRAGKPTLVSPHGMLDRWQLRQSRWKKRLALHLSRTGSMLHRADAILYGTLDEAREAGRLSLAGRVVAMPNGVEQLRLPPRDTVRAMLAARWPQIAGWHRTIVFFSRLHPKKGLDLLVEAMAETGADHPNAGLLAVGIPQDAAYEAALRRRIAEIGEDRIVLATDMVGPAARAVFATADIFALPSHQEGFSIAILEAMSAGLAVLITDQCHLPEVDEWGIGRVVPVTVDGLAQGLRDLLARDAGTLAGMGDRARARAADTFSWDSIAGRLATLYRELAGA